MTAMDLGVTTVDQAVRLVRALGSHRYVAGRLHLLHAMVVASVPDDAGGALGEARGWALATLSASDLDPASRDERLWRRSTEAEVAAVLEAFWVPGDRARASRDALRAHLVRSGLDAVQHDVFDEATEERIHPLGVDAGWELHPLRELDAERHKGAIAAFGDPMAFEVALFEEETAIPEEPSLYELPAIGADELLRAADDDGALVQPFVVWAQGNAIYLDYVFRGIERAAKLNPAP
jgi:hypothetical protein